MANGTHPNTVGLSDEYGHEHSAQLGANSFMNSHSIDRRSMLHAMGAVLLTGCAGTPSGGASSTPARTPRRVPLGDASVVDLFWIHAALQMEAANQVGGSAPDLMKALLAREYYPDDGKTELLRRTGAGPEAIKALHKGRFQESIAPMIALWSNAELTCNLRLNPQGNRYLNAEVDGLWHSGGLNFNQRVDIIDLPNSMTRGRQGAQGWTVRLVEWFPSIAGPLNSFELKLNDGTRGALTCKGFFDLPVRIPLDRSALQQLIVEKLKKDPANRDSASRRLIYDADVEIVLKPQLPTLTNEREWWGVKTGRQIGRMEWVASVERIANTSVR